MYDHLLMYAPSNSKRKPYRSTQIIATVPNTVTDKDKILDMIEAGMNIASFPVDKQNDEKTVLKTLGTLREAVKDYNESRKQEAEQQEKQSGMVVPNIPVHVATALDIQAEPILTGKFQSESVFNATQRIKLTNDIVNRDASTSACVYIEYADLTALPIGQTVIIVADKGKIRIHVDKAAADGLEGSIENDGIAKQGAEYKVYFPGAKLKLPGANMSKYCDFCKKNKIDMIFVPINTPSIFKQIACMANADNSAVKLKVIAKLEGQEAVVSIDKILEHANGVMLSRRNLGEAIKSPEQVIVYQKNVIAKCLRAGIPSIVANDVLKSMEVAGGEPSRAEFADVVNAVLDGSDCIMLDEKTSTKEAINTMCSVILEAEDMINYRRLYRELISQVSIPPTTYDFTETIAIAACTAAMVNASNAIIVLTDNGKAVRRVAKYRPECPIIAVTKKEEVARQCLMSRGVFSIVYGKIIISEINIKL